MSRKLLRLRASEVTRILQQYGFILASQRGSRQKWSHPDTKRQRSLCLIIKASNAEQAAKEVLSLQVHPSLAQEDLEEIIEGIKNA